MAYLPHSAWHSISVPSMRRVAHGLKSNEGGSRDAGPAHVPPQWTACLPPPRRSPANYTDLGLEIAAPYMTWLPTTQTGRLNQQGGVILRYLKGLLIITLLIVSKRYREKWRAARDQLSETCDALEADQRRRTALKNGGRPKLTVL